MLEFDFTKPYHIEGSENGMFYIQNGRKYAAKSKGSPQILRQIGAERTEGGGQVYKCLFCLQPFRNAVKMGRHYRESQECRDYVKKRRLNMMAERSARIHRTTFATEILNKILGVENDSH